MLCTYYNYRPCNTTLTDLGINLVRQDEQRSDAQFLLDDSQAFRYFADNNMRINKMLKILDWTVCYGL